MWVLEQNTNAQAFYRERGGRYVERQCREPLPGFRLRYAWKNPVQLLEGSKTVQQESNRDPLKPAAASPTLRSTKSMPMSEVIRPSDVSDSRNGRQLPLTWMERPW